MLSPITNTHHKGMYKHHKGSNSILLRGGGGDGSPLKQTRKREGVNTKRTFYIWVESCLENESYTRNTIHFTDLNPLLLSTHKIFLNHWRVFVSWHTIFRPFPDSGIMHHGSSFNDVLLCLLAQWLTYVCCTGGAVCLLEGGHSEEKQKWTGGGGAKRGENELTHFLNGP